MTTATLAISGRCVAVICSPVSAQSGYEVRYVMNVTDVDDKIIRNAARDGLSVQQYYRAIRKGLSGRFRLLKYAAGIHAARNRLHRRDAKFVADLEGKGFAYAPRMDRTTFGLRSLRTMASFPNATSTA